MSIDFKDRVAIVTGAGNGLGKDYSIFLASRGAKVVVNDFGVTEDGFGHSQNPARITVDEITKKGGIALANFDTVADRSGAQNIVNYAIQEFDHVDILINNAGILRDKLFIKMTNNDFNEVLKVHLMGSVYMTKASLPHMINNKYGRIVMTSSIAGLFGNFGQTNYSTAKLGIIGFMNSLKLEVAKYNIAVNTVAPLAITRLAAISGIFSEDLEALLRPEFVTPIVAYLCSNDCKTSGEIFCAGGGFFSKAEILQSRGIRFNHSYGITPEKIAENIESILNMDDAISFSDAKKCLRFSLQMN